MNLESMLSRLDTLTDEQMEELKSVVAAATSGRKFIPSPGPQTAAWNSLADICLYGGEMGGGKSGLICGLALEKHKRSLLMRREYNDLQGGGGLIEMLLGLHGDRRGFNGSPPATLRTGDGRIITFGAAKNVGDEMSYAGRARDLLAIDEAAQFAEQQVRLLMAWVRSEIPGQRCRTVLASNPPLDSVGDWMIGMFRPWLDITHSNPAKHGELRWFVTAPDGTDIEVPDPTPIQLDGCEFKPHSRTFIHASLSDNPFLVGTDYERQRDALQEPWRSALRDGNFMIARRDQENQVIPTDWVRAAQARWTNEPPAHAPMSAIALDIAQGGPDRTVAAARFDSWFAPLVMKEGKKTPDGPSIAAIVVELRRNGAAVILDMGGGYGGSAADHLKSNGIPVVRYNGANATSERTADQAFKFTNMRAKAYWRLREALDPGQDGGSPIALPDDPELLGDLTAPTFKVTPHGLKIEDKAEIKKRLGRSTDKGDAVVMCWSGGPKTPTHGKFWDRYRAERTHQSPTANVGYANRRMPKWLRRFQ